MLHDLDVQPVTNFRDVSDCTVAGSISVLFRTFVKSFPRVECAFGAVVSVKCGTPSTRLNDE